MKKFAADLNVNHNKSRTRRAVLLGLGLLVILSASFAAFTFLAPPASSQSQMASPRAGWYLRSDQWHADVRTLAAAFEYMMDLATDAPAGTSSPTNQLASPFRPVIPYSLATTQVNAGDRYLPKS